MTHGPTEGEGYSYSFYLPTGEDCNDQDTRDRLEKEASERAGHRMYVAGWSSVNGGRQQVTIRSWAVHLPAPVMSTPLPAKVEKPTHLMVSEQSSRKDLLRWLKDESTWTQPLTDQERAVAERAYSYGRQVRLRRRWFDPFIPSVPDIEHPFSLGSIVALVLGILGHTWAWYVLAFGVAWTIAGAILEHFRLAPDERVRLDSESHSLPEWTDLMCSISGVRNSISVKQYTELQELTASVYPLAVKLAKLDKLDGTQRGQWATPEKRAVEDAVKLAVSGFKVRASQMVTGSSELPASFRNEWTPDGIVQPETMPLNLGDLR